MRKSLSKKSQKVISEMSSSEELCKVSLAQLAREGAKVMLQVALEEEITDFLERDHYQRSEKAKGYRNGSKPRRVKLGCGDVEIDMPQARDAGEPFHSHVLPPYQTRMKELEEAIPLLYLNGLSTRRVKRGLEKVVGNKGLSHTTVNKITHRVIEKFKEWRQRRLDITKVMYLFLDGIRIGVRAGTKEKEAILVAIAFLEDGRREVLSVGLGNKESYPSWKGFLDELRERGLGDPLLIITDGCPGLLRAIGEVFAGVETQRCTKHRMENVLVKVPKKAQEEVKDDLRRIFYGASLEHALEALRVFERKWGKVYPAATDCLLNNIEDCLTYYQFPYEHWKRIRTTNSLERTFREVKQRVKVIGRFKDEEMALATVWWLMQDAQERWKGIRVSQEAREILTRLSRPTTQEAAA